MWGRERVAVFGVGGFGVVGAGGRPVNVATLTERGVADSPWQFSPDEAARARRDTDEGQVGLASRSLDVPRSVSSASPALGGDATPSGSPGAQTQRRGRVTRAAHLPAGNHRQPAGPTPAGTATQAPLKRVSSRTEQAGAPADGATTARPRPHKNANAPAASTVRSGAAGAEGGQYGNPS